MAPSKSQLRRFASEPNMIATIRAREHHSVSGSADSSHISLDIILYTQRHHRRVPLLLLHGQTISATTDEQGTTCVLTPSLCRAARPNQHRPHTSRTTADPTVDVRTSAVVRGDGAIFKLFPRAGDVDWKPTPSDLRDDIFSPRGVDVAAQINGPFLRNIRC